MGKIILRTTRMECLMKSRCDNHRVLIRCWRRKKCLECWTIFSSRLSCRIRKLRLRVTEHPLTLTKIRFRKCTTRTLQIKSKQVEELQTLTKRPDIKSYKIISMALAVQQWWRRLQQVGQVSREMELTVQCTYNRTTPTQRTTCRNCRILAMHLISPKWRTMWGIRIWD